MARRRRRRRSAGAPGADAGHRILALHGRGQDHHRAPAGRFKADNGQALVSGALAGLGIAALPDFLIEEHLATGALVPLLVQYPLPEAGLYVVRPPGSHPPRKVRTLIEIMVERFGAPRSEGK